MNTTGSVYLGPHLLLGFFFITEVLQIVLLKNCCQLKFILPKTHCRHVNSILEFNQLQKTNLKPSPKTKTN